MKKSSVTDKQYAELDIPVWVIEAPDKEARRPGIAREDLIKTWLVDRLDLLAKKTS
jgi:hypothetical protein